MYEPDPQDPAFGSEVRRRETPEHRRARRRATLWAALLGVLMGLVAIGAGIHGMRTGVWVSGGPGQISLPGEWVVAMGVFVLVLSGWLLRRWFAGNEPV